MAAGGRTGGQTQHYFMVTTGHFVCLCACAGHWAVIAFAGAAVILWLNMAVGGKRRATVSKWPIVWRAASPVASTLCVCVSFYLAFSVSHSLSVCLSVCLFHRYISTQDVLLFSPFWWRFDCRRRRRHHWLLRTTLQYRGRKRMGEKITVIVLFLVITTDAVDAVN